MIGIIKDLVLMENQKKARDSIGYAIDTIMDTYNEWKKIERRRNAVNIVTTSVNKITTIDPSTIEHLHETAKTKLATIVMRCMDLPPWSTVEEKRKIYRRLFPIIKKIQYQTCDTGTGGNLMSIIATRLSACLTYNSPEQQKNIFVAYEPTVSKRYLRFIFGEEYPEHVLKMEILPLPEDYDVLINILNINHAKACKKILGGDND
jgi:hypothetical protein